MAQPYVGEIRLFAGSFAPVGWQFCDGSTLPISEYETLFQLIGTTYGGDGQETFQVPDLRGRVPLHQGNGFVLAETGGAESITLTVPQIPAHTHPLLASTGLGTSPNPAGNVLASGGSGNVYRESPAATPMFAAVGPVGGSQPHENMAPFLGLTFILSLYGIFPTPS